MEKHLSEECVPHALQNTSHEAGKGLMMPKRQTVKGHMEWQAGEHSPFLRKSLTTPASNP